MIGDARHSSSKFRRATLLYMLCAVAFTAKQPRARVCKYCSSADRENLWLCFSRLPSMKEHTRCAFVSRIQSFSKKSPRKNFAFEIFIEVDFSVFVRTQSRDEKMAKGCGILKRTAANKTVRFRTPIYFHILPSKTHPILLIFVHPS